MASLIYIAIIVLWIAVLIPMWLRRMDRVSEEKSTARFSSAMELLGSKVTADTAVTDGAAARDPQPPVTPRLAAERARKDAQLRAIASARRAAVRRSVVLSILMSVLVATLILAIVRTIAQWVPVATASLVIAFVIASALTASSRAEALAGRGSSAPKRSREVRGARALREAKTLQEDREHLEPVEEHERLRRPVPRTTSARAGSPRAATVALETDRPRARQRIIAPPDVSPRGAPRRTVDLTRDEGGSVTEAIPVIDEAYVARARATS